MFNLAPSMWRRSAVLPIAIALFGTSMPMARAQSAMYSPISISSNQPVTDSLSPNDIPTGFGGFARDYTIEFMAGDQVAIDLTSDQFDTLISLLGPDGSTVGENDDGPDGTTNSLLFARITTAGSYTVRVRSYAGEGAGIFTLQVTRLEPID